MTELAVVVVAVVVASVIAEHMVIVVLTLPPIGTVSLSQPNS